VRLRRYEPALHGRVAGRLLTDDDRADGWDDSEHCAIARAVRFNYPRAANVWLYVGALTAAGVVGH